MYNLTIYDNYLLIAIDEKVYLIDTGSNSMTFDENNHVKINNETFSLRRNKLTKEEMIHSFGRIINGSIGKDIIKFFGIVEVDIEKNLIEFGQTKYLTGKCIPLNDFNIDIEINGKKMKSYMDTGAHITLVTINSMLNKADYLKNYIETSFMGNLNVEVYNAAISLDKESKSSKVIYSSLVGMYNRQYSAYFSMMEFATKYFVISYKQNTIYYE